MITIKHKFRDYQINKETETLIIGTFNPDRKGNEADFFYGRKHSFFWPLLAKAFGESNLKDKVKEEKIEFIRQKKIDFIDLISEVKINENEIDNIDTYKDKYLDGKVNDWRKVVDEIEKLDKIKRIGFTRKTFSDIPEMKKRITEIEEYCEQRKIHFEYLKTPSRGYSIHLQKLWTDFLLTIPDEAL